MDKRVTGFRKILLDVKIYFRINFIYPRNKSMYNIRSILPARIKQIGENVVIEENVDFGPFLNELPDGLYIGSRSMISYCNKIGKFTSISFDVKIGVVSHPLGFISTSPLFYARRRGWVQENKYDETKDGFVEIGNDVLISANVIVKAGIKIGNGAIIGAGSFINKDVPPYAIVAGIPGKIIRYRFEAPVIEALEKICYWNLPQKELLKYEKYFNDPEHFAAIISSKPK